MSNKQNFTLEVEERDKSIKASSLRKKGLLPGVVYGHDFKALSIAAPYLNFIKLYEAAGENNLIDLSIKGKGKFKVLVREIARHPLTDKIIHFDLYKVKMTEKLETTIALKFIGESPAVVEAGGVLVKNLDEIEVKCLPSDLVSEIEVDLSSLKKFGDVIKVSDLKIPNNIEVLNDPQLIVATVVEPREEEVEIGAKIEEKVEEVEVEKKGKEAKEEVEEEKE